MGKIFNALKKASNKHEAAIPTNETFYTKKNLKKTEEKDIIDDGIYSLFENKNVDKNLVSLLNPNSVEAEQFKMLRSNILFPVSGDIKRSILITSALPNEGKSFLAANLSISIAKSNKHVLLMDCDMRRPSINSILNIDDKAPGLCDYLKKPLPLSSLLLKTKIDQLTVLPAGKMSHNPSELASSEKMSNLLYEVKERYADRYIIIDSPPAQLSAETKALANAVDGVIIVVKYGATKRELVAELIEMFGRKKIIGIAVNQINKKISNYKSYGYYN